MTTKKKKNIKIKKRPNSNLAKASIAFGWDPGHFHPGLDNDRIEPENYDGPNPYKRKITKRYAKNHDAIVKKESHLISDKHYHKIIFENISAIEFANLDKITIEWIVEAHKRFSHPREFPLGDGSFYKWGAGSEYIPVYNFDDRVEMNIPFIKDIEKKVLAKYKSFHSEIHNIFLEAILNKNNDGRPSLEIKDNLGELKVKCVAGEIDLQWQTLFQNFKQALLRDFVEFYFKHPYCLDLVAACNFCGKFMILSDPRKAYCSSLCRDKYNNKQKKNKKISSKK